MTYKHDPMGIERESMRIIAEEIRAAGKTFPRLDPRFDALVESIVSRAIHTSADFDYLDNLVFDISFLERVHAMLEAKTPVTLYTDTTMALSGINKNALSQIGWRAVCYVADADVAEAAKAAGMTRSMAAVDKALAEPGAKLFVFGNAPTAIFRLLERWNAAEHGGRDTHDASDIVGVIGVPVGFVGAAESKQLLAESDLPSIAALGRKGGSNIAASIVNALLYERVER